MNYYRCYIKVQLKHDGTMHTPEEISDIVDTVLEGSTIKRMPGTYIYDFMSLKLDVAGNHLLLKMPYFKGCQWSQCSVAPPAFTRWYVERDGSRMFMEEIKPQHVGIETRFHFFEGLCCLVDMLQDEHVVERHRVPTSMAEMTANSYEGDPDWALLCDNQPSSHEVEMVRERLGFPKKEANDG